MKLLPSLFFFLFLLFLCRENLTEAFLFLLAATLHEAGHVISAALLGCGIRRFSLSPEGATVKIDFSLLPYKKEIAVYLAGPAGNGIGMLIAFFLLRHHFTANALYFFFCNLLFLLFNLLPVKGLDGYQALSSFFRMYREEEGVESILTKISGFFYTLLLAGGVLLLILCRNASLFFFCLFLIPKRKTKKAT